MTVLLTDLARQQCFWERRPAGRPLLGINIGFAVEQRCPRLMASIPSGPVRPEDVRTDLFLADCDALYQLQRGFGDYSRMICVLGRQPVPT